MTTAAAYKMHIPPDKVEQTRKFFRERGGVLLWSDQEIGGPGRPEVMTPATHEDGTPATKPHWAYGDPRPLKPEDIAVRSETPCEPPESVTRSHDCTYCDLAGRNSLGHLAQARDEALVTTKRLVAEGKITVDDLRPDDTYRCGACAGRGYDYKPVLLKLKKHWTGGRYPVSEDRARKVAALIGADVLYHWQPRGDGFAEVKFYREQVTPFTLE